VLGALWCDGVARRSGLCERARTLGTFVQFGRFVVRLVIALFLPFDMRVKRNAVCVRAFRGDTSRRASRGCTSTSLATCRSSAAARTPAARSTQRSARRSTASRRSSGSGSICARAPSRHRCTPTRPTPARPMRRWPHTPACSEAISPTRD
jgi:hypothetical protein